MINLSQQQETQEKKNVIVAISVPYELHERLRRVCYQNRTTKQEIGLTGLISEIENWEAIA